MSKNKKTYSNETYSKVETLKKQIFDLKLTKTISGTYDKKKVKELKNQVISLYSSEK